MLNFMFDNIKTNISRKNIIKKMFGVELNRAYFCMYARNGIYWYAKNLLLTNKFKNEALVPAFSCGDELYAIKKAGFVLKFYDHNSINVTVDLIRDNISIKTGLVLVIHNFGIYNTEIKEISKIMRKRKIKTLEDCAYIFANNKLQKQFFSDCRVFSLRKHFSIPHGGLIQLSKKEHAMKKFLPPNNEIMEKELFFWFAKKTGYLKSGAGIQLLYSELSIENEHLCGPRGGFNGYDLDISNFALFLLSKTKFNLEMSLRKKRAKKIIKILSSGQKNFNFNIVSKDFNHATTFVFLKLNKILSSVADKRIKKSGIPYTQPFWNCFHDIINWDLFPFAKEKKENILAIRLDIDIPQNILYQIKKLI